MKRIFTISALLLSLGSFAQTRELVWPEGKMPHSQDGQIAAMTRETREKGFKREEHRIAYLDWYDAPAEDVRNGGCMILISGGSYICCCDWGLIDSWSKTFTALGFQCVNFVYRTPRPEGLPIYQTAWEDGQRAVRMVRSEATARGFDPEKIGAISMSAGSHLNLLLATSSLTPAYEKIDSLDDIPCHINWAIVNSPGFATTDGASGTLSTYEGYGPGVALDSVFKFDEKTCPMSFQHGGNDPVSPFASTLAYRELRKRGIPAEVHIFPDEGHSALGLDRAIEFMTQMGYIAPLKDTVEILDRYASDADRKYYLRENIWPEGKTPDFRENQWIPYIEWHFPKEKKTDAIQIIYSGGAYGSNDPGLFEVTPVRRYLNEKGMTVVTMKYRTPRPEGLPKHITAWQDLQRAIRIVRSRAAEYGLDPDRIGIMGSSAGGHLTLMGVTSSRHQSYLPIDEIDKLKCNVQWGIGIYPAYVLSDDVNGYNSNGGNTDDAIILPEFSFDLDTAPMLLMHGDADAVAAMGSVKVWEKMRMMGIQSELHTLALRKHCFQNRASPGTGSYNWIDHIWDFLTRKGYNK